MPKPFKDYDEMVCILKSRGMKIPDEERAKRKLSQVGYYRLSGYSFTSRAFEKGVFPRKYKDTFRAGTDFDSVFRLYLFDKKLRIAFFDALERIEVNLRTIIAHEMGKEHPLIYTKKNWVDKSSFEESAKVSHGEWVKKNKQLIENSHEQFIRHHIDSGRPIPIWVLAELWEFGSLVRFYSLMKGSYKERISARMGLENDKDGVILKNWLINLNVLRNRCAHHSRLFNRPNARSLRVPKCEYFSQFDFSDKK